MHEQNRLLTYEAAAAVGLSLALVAGVSACSSEVERPNAYIEDCYDSALDIKFPDRITDDPVEIDMEQDGSVAEDPVKANAELARKARAGLVQIFAQNEDGKTVEGSGFLTRDSKGQAAVVTAAHLLAGSKLSKVEITDDLGKTAGVVAGCQIYENYQRESQPMPGDGKAASYDIAVLRPAEGLDATPLKIAPEAPKRGTWTYVFNYQGEHMPGRPANYTALVGGWPEQGKHDSVTDVTAEPERGIFEEQFQERNVTEGASGGPTVNRKGQVTGITVTGTSQEDTRDRQWLAEQKIVVGGPGEQLASGPDFTPGSAMTMGPQVIMAALESPNSSAAGK